MQKQYRKNQSIYELRFGFTISSPEFSIFTCEIRGETFESLHFCIPSLRKVSKIVDVI